MQAAINQLRRAGLERFIINFAPSDLSGCLLYLLDTIQSKESDKLETANSAIRCRSKSSVFFRTRSVALIRTTTGRRRALN